MARFAVFSVILFLASSISAAPTGFNHGHGHGRNGTNCTEVHDGGRHHHNARHNGTHLRICHGHGHHSNATQADNSSVPSAAPSSDAPSFIASTHGKPSTRSSATPTGTTKASTAASEATITSTKEAASTTAASTTSSAASSTTSSSTSSSDEEQYLSIHNDLRAKHDADALTWDDSLAASAQAWADQCNFSHSQSGENLAAGTGDFSISAALNSWANEESQYAGDFSSSSGHYSQMVWKSTTKLGCAVAKGCTGIFGSTPANYYVCHYDPAGNVLGQFDENVS